MLHVSKVQRSSKILFQIDDELRSRLRDFRFSNRFASEADTIRTLMNFALDLIECGEPPPVPGEDRERVLKQTTA